MSSILIPTLWIGGVAAICGAALALAARFFGVEEDPRVLQVVDTLPGSNCGGCGYAGCLDYARAMVKNNAPTNLCTPGGPSVAAKLAEMLGGQSLGFVKRVAQVLCCGNNTVAKKRFAYNGIADCAAAATTAGGDKGCTYGCLGYGSCARVCPTNAIAIVDGLAKVQTELCIACGKCVAACPRRIIKLVPAEREIHVRCSNKDKGPAVKPVCSTGCIGCRICVKLSDGAINMDGFLAVVDYGKPLTNEEVVAKCPAKCIQKG
jgi:Na+-translocating ferredoxin:NAD+ oxidoreductase RNF subunit RnfB